VKFFHVRHHNHNGILLANGGCTFAMVEETRPDLNVRWGVCKCHENDAFNKRTGRIKAAGRAISNKYFFLIPMLSNEEQVLFVENLSYFIFIHYISHPTEVEIAASLENAKKGVIASSTFRTLQKKNK
jgi:hypothetical protein